MSGAKALSFIQPEAPEELIRALAGKTHDLKIDRVVRLDAVLGALRDGVSFLEIIRRTIWQLEASLIEKVITSTQGSKPQAAQLLKIDYETLYRCIYKYGLEISGDQVPMSIGKRRSCA